MCILLFPNIFFITHHRMFLLSMMGAVAVRITLSLAVDVFIICFYWYTICGKQIACLEIWTWIYSNVWPHACEKMFYFKGNKKSNIPYIYQTSIIMCLLFAMYLQLTVCFQLKWLCYVIDLKVVLYKYIATKCFKFSGFTFSINNFNLLKHKNI